MTELLAILGSGPFRIRTPDKPQVEPVPYDDVETSDLCGEMRTAVDVCVEHVGKKNLGEVGNPVERISTLLDPRRKTLSKQECVNGSPDVKQLAINELKDVADLFEGSAPQQTTVPAASASAPAPAPASALAPAPAPPPAPAPGGDGATGPLVKKPRVLAAMEQRRANRLAAAGSAGDAGDEVECGSGPSITHKVRVLEELTRYVAEGVELEEDGLSLPGFGGEGAPLSFLKRQARLSRKRLCHISRSSHAFTTGSRPRTARLSETFLLSLCSSATCGRVWAPSRWSR